MNLSGNDDMPVRTRYRPRTADWSPALLPSDGMPSYALSERASNPVAFRRLTKHKYVPSA